MADLTNDQILAIMKCIQGKIPCIREDWYTFEPRVRMADHLDKNPLFQGKDVPTQPNRYNVWRYIGKVPGVEL